MEKRNKGEIKEKKKGKRGREMLIRLCIQFLMLLEIYQVLLSFIQYPII